MAPHKQQTLIYLQYPVTNMTSALPQSSRAPKGVGLHYEMPVCVGRESENRPTLQDILSKKGYP